MLGIALARLPPGSADVALVVDRLQHELFVAQTELAAPPGSPPPPARIEERHVTRLEADLDALSAKLPPLRTFVLSRGAGGAAELQFARTVARRAERELWTLHRSTPQRSEILRWSNRLSGLLFALALAANHGQGIREVPPDYSA